MKIIKPSDPIVLLQGQLCRLAGNTPKLGAKVPDFTLSQPFEESISLAQLLPKSLLLCFGLSVDTPMTANVVRLLATRVPKDLQCVIFTRDLSFALQRFMQHEKLTHLKLLSASTKLGEDYGVLIQEGPCSGLFTHALMLVDGQGKLRYCERPMDLTHEPDVELALAQLK